MEAYVGIGLSVPLAVQRVDESLGLRQPESGAAPVVDVVTPAQNDAALAALEAMMGGARPK